MTAAARERWRLEIAGVAQGVGFRPGVYRLAERCGVAGWVANAPSGATIEVEGEASAVESFRARLAAEASPLASPMVASERALPLLGEERFAIRESGAVGAPRAALLPDIAMCEACLSDVFDPANRRFRHPFANCSHCGPRFGVLERLPYDRANTTMARFAMCDACEAEYRDPANRRFHAQPICCPDCGPRLAALDTDGRPLALGGDALGLAVERLRGGGIVALKSIGGFLLLVDARDEAAVRRLRERKRRPDKPLAVLFRDVEAIRGTCLVSREEEALLRSSAAPIVLLAKRGGGSLAPSVAPRVADIGAMLPCSPLHHLLARDCGFPLVATSGNRSGEPLCVDDAEALERLRGIADLFLTHDRPIARRLDDSVARVLLGAPQTLRVGRGLAPVAFAMPAEAGSALAEGALAVGGHLKNAVAFASGGEALLGAHVGDLDSSPTLAAHVASRLDLVRLRGGRATAVAVDLHPEYASTRAAASLGAPKLGVQHHVAHVLACAAEHGPRPPFLGVAWDGAGLGDDGTIQGGEFFRVDDQGVERVATLRAFPLPGGDAAAREPRRSAFGILFERFRTELENMRDLAPLRAFDAGERRVLAAACARGVNAPRTSSAGRLLDAVASLANVRQRCSFEGQGAMELEALALFAESEEAYAIAPPSSAESVAWDWAPMLDAIIRDLRLGVGAEAVAGRTHRALANWIVDVARRVGERVVALSGGCFQSRLLCELADERLRAAGFEPLWHRRCPPSDGGVALGQLAALGRVAKEVA